MLTDRDRRGLGDGLPVAPPTEYVVDQLVAACGREPSEVVGAIPPAWGEASIEKIAVNAAMAGCLPGHLPVVIAAVEAMLEEQFNLPALQATTHPGAPLVLVSGPGMSALGVNAGTGAFGPGFRANPDLSCAQRNGR